MIKWMTLLNKELLEMQRNYKLIWFPIAFILLGVSQPLSTYYMPQIIESAGGLPEGTVIEIPTPLAPEVLAMSINQFNTLGILIVVLASMGIVAGERKSGIAGLILTKPVSYTSYITSKWAGAHILLWLSLFIAYLASWYYVSILFGSIPFTDFFLSLLIYGLWLSAVLTLIVFFSTILRSPGLAGFLTLAFTLAINLVSNMLPMRFEWSPSLLTNYATEVLLSSTLAENTIGASITATISMIILLTIAIYLFRKKELAS
jgi:ABC-2 type transport system permease protein